MVNVSMWDRLRKELAGPWDWVAAGVGAAGGLVVSTTAAGADAGTSAGIGALAAVSARKAGAASLRRFKLKKKAEGLLGILRSYKSDQYSSEHIIREVDRDRELWKQRVLNHDQFETLLDKHAETYRQLPTVVPPE
jgi:hypothetical protein